MTAKDIMTKEVITVKRYTELRDLIRILHQNDITGVPVVDDNNIIVGIVSEKDVIRAQVINRYEVENHEDIYDLFLPSYSEVETDFVETTSYHWVEQIMTKNVLKVKVDTSVKEIASLMAKHHFHRLPVVDKENHIVGIITTIDMLKLI